MNKDKINDIGTTGVSGKKFFLYGKDMQKKMIEVNTVFLNYTADKHGQSVKVSLVEGILALVEVDQNKLKSSMPNKKRKSKLVVSSIGSRKSMRKKGGLHQF